MRPPLLNKNSLPTLSAVAATHCQSIKSSLIADTYTSNNLISSYSKCKDLNSALKVFDEMPHRDTASWNTIITAHVNTGAFPRAWKVLKSMKSHGFSFDGYTFGSTLKGIAINNSLMHGQQVHSDIVKMGFDHHVYAASALLDMYAKCNKVEDAHKVFDCMPERNTVSWNALIAGYAETWNLNRCIDIFSCMGIENVRVDDATFAPLLTLLRDVELYGLTRQLHGMIMKRGLHLENTVLNAMITAYANCGCIEDAKQVFDSGDGYRDVVTWNSILASYFEGDMEEHGFGIFLEMLRLRLEMDVYTYSSAISACFGDARMRLGKLLHGLVIKRGLERMTQISNVLISMYLKSNTQNVDDAMRIFEKIDPKDLVSWNTILTGLSQIGLSENALRLFQEMRLDYLLIDQYAFAAILRSCSDLATLGMGQQVHVIVLKSGSEGNEYVASALIFMYSKCGFIEDSLKAFKSSRKESSVTWNAIIFAYAQHGQGKIALDLFNEMTERKIKLDHITFVAALTACSHVGLVDEGLRIFKSMETEYKIPARMENYACAIDLLGRAGRLMEAKELIDEMTFEPDVMVWKTLLGACRACGDIQLATRIAAHLIEMDPGDHCTYVILSDMYSNLKRWDEKALVKRLMKVKGVKKVPGWSWIELGNDVHAFNAFDHSHPKCQEIYGVLEGLIGEIRICDRDLGFDDVDLARVCYDDYGLVSECRFDMKQGHSSWLTLQESA